MAARRGKSQARRNSGSQGTPGWVWLVAGVAIAAVVFLAAPNLFKGEGDGFLRAGPQPNPNAQPAPVADADSDVGTQPAAQPAAPKPAEPEKPAATQYDFYTLKRPGIARLFLVLQSRAMLDSATAVSLRGRPGTGEGLADRHQFQAIDVQVRRQAGHPEDLFGDVFGGHRVGAVVELVRRRLVAVGTHHGELGSAMPGSIVVTRTPVPCRSERRPSENWLTKALVPP